MTEKPEHEHEMCPTWAALEQGIGSPRFFVRYICESCEFVDVVSIEAYEL